MMRDNLRKRTSSGSSSGCWRSLPAALFIVLLSLAFPFTSSSPFHASGRGSLHHRQRDHHHFSSSTSSAAGPILKTGTTIAGIVCQNAVILAADTRSTMGPIVADKNCEKIHFISKTIFCCGAGTAADAEQLTAAVRQWLKYEQYKSLMSIADQEALPSPHVVSAATGLSRLLQRGGERGPSAAFVLGGIDPTGPHLYQIESCGTAQPVQFTALGSGSFAAMSMLEAHYRSNMTVEEGISLAHEAITSGILNDMGSGSNVDLCILHMNGHVDYRRTHASDHNRPNDHASRAAIQLIGGKAKEDKNLGLDKVHHGPIKPFRKKKLRLKKIGQGFKIVTSSLDPDEEVTLL